MNKLNKKVISLIIFALMFFSLIFLIFKVITPDNQIITENENLSRLPIFSNNKAQLELQTAPESPNLPLKMLFFGDLMLDRYVGEKIKKYSLDHLLGKLNEDDFSSGYDLVGANLEGATTNKGEHYAPHNAYDFAFNPDLISQLKNYNFNFFSLANNHLSDQGQKGIAETYQNLSEIGFNYVGCRDAYLSSSTEIAEAKLGETFPVLSEENCSDIILEIKNNKVAFFNISLVYNDIDTEKIITRIKLLKEKSEAVIVNIHFGLEYQGKANLKQENLAHAMIDAGADVVIGHHPHVVQNYEVYKGKPIFYSLGNFIFDQYFSPETQEGLAVSLDLKWEKITEGNQEKILAPIEFEVYKIKTTGSKIVEIVKDR